MTTARIRKIVRLSLVRDERKALEAKLVRASIFDCGRDVVRILGDNISGFALVSWDRKGSVSTALDCGYGPITRRRIPSFCLDALQQHVVRDLLDTELREPAPEDEGA